MQAECTCERLKDDVILSPCAFVVPTSIQFRTKVIRTLSYKIRVKHALKQSSKRPFSSSTVQFVKLFTFTHENAAKQFVCPFSLQSVDRVTARLSGRAAGDSG